ncbi:protoporphyrinogen/coproporphyrinogen oxidase [Leptospira ilyithenensis]|uniref:protoporphyrinogen/coproporphyrinogen oxidase n=1 Tax=Leptospira ilyithenensis TaxID=2484901 RepID=UPI0014384884|nr:FAD-dependent oxidoreductase [Leptospira ilyithenensis]
MSDSVLIVGGGISGLIAAHSSLKKGKKVTLIERSDRLGGMLDTYKTEFGLVETAANGFLNSYATEELLQDLNLSSIQPLASSKKRYFLIQNHLRQIPISFFSIVRTLIGFLFLNAKPKENESFESWSFRIFGKQATIHLIEPTLGGIYAAKLKDMDPRMVFSRFLWKEGDSVYRNFKNSKNKSRKKPNKKGLISFQGGMSDLISNLTGTLDGKIEILTNSEITSLEKLKKEYPDHKIIFCMNVQSTYRILNENKVTQSALSKHNIKSIPLLSLATITCFTKTSLLKKPGFGVLFPKDSEVSANGVLLNDFIFEGRVFGELHSETWIYAGEFLDHLTEEEIRNLVIADRKIVSASSGEEDIVSFHPKIWKQSFPIYGTELLKFNRYLDEIENESTASSQSIRFLGNYRYGIGLRGLIEAALNP